MLAMSATVTGATLGPYQEITLDYQYLQQKLTAILGSLESQNVQMKKYYNTKIESLMKEIEDKDKELQSLRASVEDVCKRCQTLEWKLIEKDNTIEDLNSRIKGMQQTVKQKLYRFVDELDFRLDCSTRSKHSRNPAQESQKRINISQYYIKSRQSQRQQQNLQISSRLKTTGNQNQQTEYSQNLSSLLNPSQHGSKHYKNSPYVHAKRHQIDETQLPFHFNFHQYGAKNKDKDMRDCLKNDSDPTNNVYLKVPKTMTPPKLEKVKSFEEETRIWPDDTVKEQTKTNQRSYKKLPESIKSNTKGETLVKISSPNKIHITNFIPQTHEVGHLRTNSNFHPIESPVLSRQQRKAKLEQRWKQVSAFAQKKLKNQQSRNSNKDAKNHMGLPYQYRKQHQMNEHLQERQHESAKVNVNGNINSHSNRNIGRGNKAIEINEIYQ